VDQPTRLSLPDVTLRCANGGRCADHGLAHTWPDRRTSRSAVHNRLPWPCRKRGADHLIRTRNTPLGHIGRSPGVDVALAVGRTGAIVSAYLGAGLLSLHIQLLPRTGFYHVDSVYCHTSCPESHGESRAYNFPA
jgi:hypothetical protein